MGNTEKQSNVPFYIIIAILVLFLLGQAGYLYVMRKHFDDKLSEIKIEKVEAGHYESTSFGDDIRSIKEENKELYEMVRSYRDDVKFLTEFIYKKSFKTDTIYIERNTPMDSDSAPKTFEYFSGGEGDSIQYKLSFSSVCEPNWYKLDFSINDRLTIISRGEDGLFKTTIDSENKADIEGVTVFNKKEKKKFVSRFGVGPNVSVGYGLLTKEPDVYVGIGFTFDLLGN